MILEYNLQFFAKDGPGGEKTEPATQKKLEDARKEGQVAKSKEIANGLGLLALFFVLKLWIGNMGNSFLETFSAVYNRIPSVAKLLGGTTPDREIQILFNHAILQLMIILLPIFVQPAHPINKGSFAGKWKRGVYVIRTEWTTN